MTDKHITRVQGFKFPPKRAKHTSKSVSLRELSFGWMLPVCGPGSSVRRNCGNAVKCRGHLRCIKLFASAHLKSPLLPAAGPQAILLHLLSFSQRDSKTKCQHTNWRQISQSSKSFLRANPAHPRTRPALSNPEFCWERKCFANHTLRLWRSSVHQLSCRHRTAQLWHVTACRAYISRQQSKAHMFHVTAPTPLRWVVT